MTPEQSLEKSIDYCVDKINALKAAIETETIKIKTLSTFYNNLQVLMWRRLRKKLKQDLKYWQKRLELYKPIQQ